VHVRAGFYLLFCSTFMLNDLLYLLSTSGHGCHVGTVFYGCIMYADDLIVLSLSLCSLQFMVDTCSDYAIKHSLVFNSKKTVFTIVNKPKYAISELIMDGHITQLTNHFKYLGIVTFFGGSEDLCLLRWQNLKACRTWCFGNDISMRVVYYFVSVLPTVGNLPHSQIQL